jgi:hypothetical protein
MWLGTNTYKFVAYSAGGYHCASGSLQWTVDNVPGDSFLNGAISGATIINTTITGGTESATALSNVTITSSDIESTPIGGTTPASGNFTSLATAYKNVAFTATPVFIASSYGFFTLTLTGNVTSSTITGSTIGQEITIDICQDGTGGRSFAWPPNLLNPPAINSNPSGCTIDQAIYNGVNWITTYSTTGTFAGIYNTLTFSATPIFSASSYSYFTMTLTANATSSTITGGVNGQIITIDICENGTGGFTFAWPANVTNPPPVALAANACTAVPMVYNGVNWIAGFGAPTQSHAIVMADLTNTVYGTSAIVNLFNSPVSGTIPIAGVGTYNGTTASSKCTLMTAATASTTFTLKDGASTLGTVVFGAAGVTGTINIAAPASVASGDQLSLIAPASADATAAGLNCSITFAF